MSEIIPPHDLEKSDDLQKFEANHQLEEYYSASYSGVLPPPDMMAEYEETHPGAFKALLGMAQKEQVDRHEIQRIELQTDNKGRETCREIEKRGQLFGFAIGCIALISSTFMAYNGKEIAASVIGTGGIGSLVYVFIEGKKTNSP